MGQKDKEIKAIAVGLLTQKFMAEVLIEIEQATDNPQTIQWLKDNFKNIVMNRVNLVMDFLDKRRLTADEFDNLGKATELAQVGYDMYLKAREIRRKEKEERKNMGEQVTPVQ